MSDDERIGQEFAAFDRAGGGINYDVTNPKEKWLLTLQQISKMEPSIRIKNKTETFVNINDSDIMKSIAISIPKYHLMNPYGFMFAYSVYDYENVISKQKIKTVDVALKNLKDLNDTPLSSIVNILDVVRYAKLIHFYRNQKRVIEDIEDDKFTTDEQDVLNNKSETQKYLELLLREEAKMLDLEKLDEYEGGFDADDYYD